MNEHISLPSNITQGTYLVYIQTSEGTFIKNVFLNTSYKNGVFTWLLNYSGDSLTRKIIKSEYGKLTLLK